MDLPTTSPSWLKQRLRLFPDTNWPQVLSLFWHLSFLGLQAECSVLSGRTSYRYIRYTIVVDHGHEQGLSFLVEEVAHEEHTRGFRDVFRIEGSLVSAVEVQHGHWLASAEAIAAHSVVQSALLDTYVPIKVRVHDRLGV